MKNNIRGEWRPVPREFNSIGPGILLTTLAKHEMDSPVGPAYRSMIDGSVARRAGTPEEVASAAAYLLGPDADCIIGSDLLIDGSAIAARRFGRLKPSA